MLLLGFELFGCVHRLGRAHWLGRFACKYLALIGLLPCCMAGTLPIEIAKDKELAAYGILLRLPNGTWVLSSPCD